jgi:hypothetical protein
MIKAILDEIGARVTHVMVVIEGIHYPESRQINSWAKGVECQCAACIARDPDMREEDPMISPPMMNSARCTCDNYAMVSALGELMANHWTSATNSSQRQRQVIDALSSAVVLLGADIVDGKVKILLPPLSQGEGPATYYNHMPNWEPGEEKMMAVCTGCYRHLLELPAQLPPEETEIEETAFEPPPLSAPRRSIFFYMRRAARHLRRPGPTPTSA